MSLDLSIIIVSYNTADLLDQTIQSVYEQTKRITFEIIVVDNDSKDDSCQRVKTKYPEVKLIESKENLGFGRANNMGFEHSSPSEFVLLLNSDTKLNSDTCSDLVDFLKENPEVGAVGPMVKLMDGSRQPKTYGCLPNASAMINQHLLLSSLFPKSPSFAGIFIEHDWAREMEVGWVSGVCLMVKREAYEKTGGFDKEFFLYAEDIDLCSRIQKEGWKVYRINDYAIDHLCGGSSKSDAKILRNGVMQQRNFLKIVDHNSSAFGQIACRIVIALGLVLRLCIRWIAFISNHSEGKLNFKISLYCLKDILGLTPELPQG